MTYKNALRYVASHEDDDDLHESDLEAVFAALYGRPPDDQDRAEGLWSHLCIFAGEAAESQTDEDDSVIRPK